MNCETGEIIQPSAFEDMVKTYNRFGQPTDFTTRFKEMQIAPTPIQMRRTPPTVGRKETCPCGSGLQFRHCCRYVKAN